MANIFIKIALTVALHVLLEAADPLFKKVAGLLEQAASSVGEAVVSVIISALEELASLATSLAREAEKANVPEVAEVAHRIAREAKEMARLLRNLKHQDVASRAALRKKAQTMNFGTVPKIPSQENKFGPTYTAHEEVIGGGGGGSFNVDMHGGTYTAHEEVIGVPRASSHANMFAGTNMVEPGAGVEESAIREIESQARQVEEAARKLKAKVVNTQVIPG